MPALLSSGKSRSGWSCRTCSTSTNKVYIDRHRGVLLGSAWDPGTLFVKTVKTISHDAVYDSTKFYELADGDPALWHLQSLYRSRRDQGAAAARAAQCPDILATHILKQTGSYERTSYAIQDTPDMVQQHYDRFLPPDKAALAAKILNQVGEAALRSGSGAVTRNEYESNRTARRHRTMSDKFRLSDIVGEPEPQTSQRVFAFAKEDIRVPHQRASWMICYGSMTTKNWNAEQRLIAADFGFDFHHPVKNSAFLRSQAAPFLKQAYRAVVDKQDTRASADGPR